MLDMHVKNSYLELCLQPFKFRVCLDLDIPKFSNESFKCSNDDLWLSPTAEVLSLLFIEMRLLTRSIYLLSMLHIVHVLEEAGVMGEHQRFNKTSSFNKVDYIDFVIQKIF